ncbi:hypothetical protein ACFCWG_42945 [Streptomyces sp. NPDC056390]|uniref:hypothetical protein n=1 Tax=Streptomyces sp. NPDC056390 TaxID=3345806 RepID=UPI0035D82508
MSRARRASGASAASESEELARLRPENAQLKKDNNELVVEPYVLNTVHGLVSEVAVADPAVLVGMISDQKTVHDVPHRTSCRTLGVSEPWFCAARLASRFVGSNGRRRHL